VRRTRRAHPGWLLVALAAVAALAAAADAVEVWRDGDRWLEASGSIREIVTLTHDTDADGFSRQLAANACFDPAAFADCRAFDRIGDRDAWQSLTRLRARFEGGIGKHWSAALVYDNEFRGGILDGLFAVPGAVPDTFLGAEGRIGHATGRHAWTHSLYRAWLRVEQGPLQVTVGRQRIPWGVGRLWNPIDRFNAIGPLAIEADQSPGIDAIDVRWSFTGFDQLQLVYAPGTRSSDARVAARLQGMVLDTDLGLVVGRFAQAFTVGADMAGNIGDSAWRLEAVWTDPQRRAARLGGLQPEPVERFWQVVVSLDHNFDIGSGLYVLVEHLWDQNALGLGRGRAGALLPFFQTAALPVAPDRAIALPISPDRFGGSGVVSLVSHQTGVLVGYDLGSALRGDLLVLWDWRGESAAIVPILSFTGFNSLEVSLGAQVFAGGRRSQFGAQSTLLYTQIEWFF